MDREKLKKEQKKALILHILFPIFIPIIIILAIVIVLYIHTNKNKNMIYAYVKKNGNLVEKYINGEIPKKDLVLNFKGDIDEIINCQEDDDCYYRFEVGSYGLVSEGCYIGFYYTTKDKIQNFGYYDRIIDGNNIKHYDIIEEGTDNIMYINKIKNHYYYFEDCY